MKLPNGETSELTYSDSVVRRVVCMDETDHLFTTKNDRRGCCSISYGSNEDDRKGRRNIRGSKHTIGVYTINTGGEVLLPLYIFDSFDQNISNYQVQPTWYEDLPKV